LPGLSSSYGRPHREDINRNASLNDIVMLGLVTFDRVPGYFVPFGAAASRTTFCADLPPRAVIVRR
jgi:hypothetical protein